MPDKHLRTPDEWPQMVTHAFSDGTSINVWKGTKPTSEEIEAYLNSPKGEADMDRLADVLVRLAASWWERHGKDVRESEREPEAPPSGC